MTDTERLISPEKHNDAWHQHDPERHDDERNEGQRSTTSTTLRPNVLEKVLVLNVVLLFIHAFIFYSYRTLIDVNDLVSYSPAQGAKSYITRIEHATDHHHYTAFSGPPSDENNRAWENLIAPTFFNTSSEEIINAGDNPEDSVELAGGGYVAALGVYHEIHCLRRLRFFLYKDTYYPNLTEANMEYLHGHLDHCLEALRVSIMCSADISLYTFRWDTSDVERALPKSNSSRKCVDWEKLEEWAHTRKVPLAPTLIRTNGQADVVHI